MSNSIFTIEPQGNEPVLNYAPGSIERERIEAELERQAEITVDVPVVIKGQEVRTGNVKQMVMPHNHGHVLGTCHQAGEKEIKLAIEAAMDAKSRWEALDWYHRAAIALKAAELITTKYRYILNAATMLTQSKNVFQAEIDAACELADFLRLNAFYMSEIYRNQPDSTHDTINRLEFRPLEGYILAVTPFNFTAIAGNLTSCPAMMGNTVVWKPASTAVLSGYYLMQLFKEAGFPDGVINFIPCSGASMGRTALQDSRLGGIHFTGSTAVFQKMWREIGQNIENYHAYPRIVGETGGKDFVVAHPSADLNALCTGLIRGAFEYQGQKCSAASRAYIPQSLWPKLKEKMSAALGGIKVGDPRDYTHFVNAVIDKKSFDRIMGYIETAKNAPEAEIIFGGTGDDSQGYFVDPTVIQVNDPQFVTMVEEIFGPVLTVYVYADEDYTEILDLCDQTSPYALTGAIFARDRQAIETADNHLRHAAGNFYINDKPTGAVVGQQPFGGARASGTNDKAGSMYNLLRWVSLRTIKENLVPPDDYRYPFMGK